MKSNRSDYDKSVMNPMTRDLARDAQAQTLRETLEDSEIERLLASAPKRPMAAKLLVGMQVLLVAIAVPPGIMMLNDPSGSTIGGQSVLPHLTQALPFIHDFVPIGIWLLSIFGILPIFVAFGVWRSRRWAWYGSTFLGATVVTWIGIELLLFNSLGFTFWYPLIGGIGLAILALSSMPTLGRFLKQ
jgi:hypothetical protein